jgi:hypothetical protein
VPRWVVAFEIESRPHVMHVPLSYELSVARGGSDWRAVAREPALRVYREQVYSPRTFVFRVVLPRPTRADRVRLTVGQPLPGYDLVVHEARVYVQDG